MRPPPNTARRACLGSINTPSLPRVTGQVAQLHRRGCSARVSSGLELHARASDALFGSDRGGLPLRIVREGAQPRQVHRCVFSTWSLRSARNFWILSSSCWSVAVMIAFPLRRLHRLVVDLAADDGAVVARIGHAQLLAHLLDLLQVLGVRSLPSETASFTFSRKASSFLSPSKPALDAVLDSHFVLNA